MPRKFKFIGAIIGPFLFVQLASAFYDDYGVMKVLEKEMLKMMESAKECVPRNDQLCTGVKFPPEKLQTLTKADLAACKDALTKRNYKLKSEKEIGDRYPEFTNSTKRALTLFDEKLVLFKDKEFNRIDCIHELLHVYQHDPNSNWDLAPATRKYVENKFLVHLNKAVVHVEKAEKAGDIKSAKDMNEKLQPFITLLQEWARLNDWFDEKDVHYFIYSHCAELKCTDLDLDIAVSNLFKLIDYFPEETKDLIRAEAAKLLAGKEEKALNHVKKTWRPTPFNKPDVSRWLSLSWEDLFGKLKEKDIRFARVNNSAKFKELETIPEKFFAVLPEVAHDKLQNSKVASGDAFAKFVPPNTILVTPITTRASLVHEYLHYLQFKANAQYAKALTEGSRLMPLFLAGKLNRQTYEETTLINNALFAMGELEVYEALAQHKESISSLEHQNNLELLSFYRKKLKR